MSNEIIWSPQKVADLAVQLSFTGEEYRLCISQIYNIYNQLGLNQTWTGKNYNRVAIEVFNNTLPKFQEWADYIQLEIPQTICTIAQEQSQGGVVTFNLSQPNASINSVQLTEEPIDGSQRINISTVRNEITNTLPANFDSANNKLQEYYTKFEALENLRGNQAISNIFIELENIIGQCRAILNAFNSTIQDSVEKTVQSIELTDEETTNIANNLRSILGL